MGPTMSEFNIYAPDSHEQPRPSKYTGTCPGCGEWLKSSEHDGYCRRCADPQEYAGDCADWAGRIGWTVLLNLDSFSEESIFVAVKSAAHYALEVVGRERVAA
jgi:hypothetical protein